MWEIVVLALDFQALLLYGCIDIPCILLQGLFVDIPQTHFCQTNRSDDSPIFTNHVYQSSDMSSKFCANSKCNCRVQFEAHYYNSRSCPPPLSHGITILMLRSITRMPIINKFFRECCSASKTCLAIANKECQKYKWKNI
jgi:hypothetical protein